MDQDTAKRLYQRILLSRLRILNKYPFYGLLLMHLKFGITSKVETTMINKDLLQFNPDYLDSINEIELDLVMLHNILHIALDHVYRSKDFSNKNIYQKATDLIVNSNLYDSFIKAKDRNMIAVMDSDDFNMPHQYKTKKECEEAIKYDVETLYNKLLLAASKSSSGDGSNQNSSDDDSKDKSSKQRKYGGDGKGSLVDDHSSWDGQGSDAEAKKQSLMWKQRMLNASESLQVSRSKNCGDLPLGIERMLDILKNPQHNWKEILQDFIQEDINDYSFNPPDKRFNETDFFLPDYNEKDDKVKNILFMIDTSGSMSDEQILEMYSEVKGAIDQFNGRLEGKLGFFDACVVPPISFCNEDEFKVIKPYGGGGTSFLSIFDYVKEKMQDEPPESIIIMTDGYAPFPEECEIPDVPLLWIINNEEITPPYGKVIRIKSEENYENWF